MVLAANTPKLKQISRVCVKNDFLCINLKTYEMIKTIKTLLGLGPSPDFYNFHKNGAIILDVRSQAEFENNHIQGAISMPLSAVNKKMNQLKKDKIIITCCASGARSASAKVILKNNGFTEVYNGGSWKSLQKRINTKK